MVTLLLAGLGLMALVAALGGLVAGVPAAVAAAGGGAVALLIQLAARAIEGRLGKLPPAQFMARWLIGTLLRLVGILGMAALIVLDREVFLPLPTALGFLGVILPLLGLELRAMRAHGG